VEALVSRIRQPIIRVRRVDGRAVTAPEMVRVVALLQPLGAPAPQPDGREAAAFRFRGFALKLRP
jgi:hypothetical protein